MSSPFSDADQEIQIIKAYVAAVTCKTLHSDFVNMAEVSMNDQMEVQAPTRSLVFAGNLVLSCSGHVDRPVPPACLIECGYFCKHGCNNRAHVFSKQCDHFQRTLHKPRLCLYLHGFHIAFARARQIKLPRPTLRAVWHRSAFSEAKSELAEPSDTSSNT